MEIPHEQLEEVNPENKSLAEQVSLTAEELEDLQWPTARAGWSTYWIKRLGPLSTRILRIEADKIFETIRHKAKVAGVVSNQIKYGAAKYQQKKARKLNTDFVDRHTQSAQLSVESKEDVLWESLFEGATKGNPELRNHAKKLCQDTYSDHLEMIEVFFELRDYLNIQSTLDKHKRRRHRFFDPKTLEKRKKMFEEITEYQFLITDFILKNNDNKEFCNTFWKFGLQTARQNTKESSNLFDRLKRSVLSQVAAFRIMEYIGYQPQLASPREDAFDAIDMWTFDSAVQIKGTPEDKPAILKTRIITFPVIETHDTEHGTFYVNAFLTQNFEKFKVKLENYIKRANTSEPVMIEGLLLSIPYSQFDQDTGEPTEEVIKYFEDNLSR